MSKTNDADTIDDAEVDPSPSDYGFYLVCTECRGRNFSVFGSLDTDENNEMMGIPEALECQNCGTLRELNERGDA